MAKKNPKAHNENAAAVIPDANLASVMVNLALRLSSVCAALREENVWLTQENERLLRTLAAMPGAPSAAPGAGLFASRSPVTDGDEP